MKGRAMVVEKGLCEALLGHSGKRLANDVNNNLIAYDIRGRAADVTIPEWDDTFPAAQPGIIRWWEDDYAETYRHQMNKDILLTNN